jgi:hypothetical protein
MAPGANLLHSGVFNIHWLNYPLTAEDILFAMAPHGSESAGDARRSAAATSDASDAQAPSPRIMPLISATWPVCWLSSTRRCPTIQLPVITPKRG